jgi:O-antigen/teichoic acid export membrane protein
MTVDSTTSRLKANVARLVGGSALSQLILFVATPLLTRLYGPDVFGIFAVYGGLHAIIAGIFTLKYDLAIVMPQDDVTARRLTFATMGLSVGFSVLSGAALALGALALGEVPPIHWLALPVGAITAAALTCSQQWGARANSYGDFAAGQVVGAIVNVTLASLTGVWSDGHVSGLLLGFVVGQAASVVFVVIRRPPAPGVPTVAEVVEAARAFCTFPLHVLPSRVVLTVGASLLPLVGERLYSIDDVGLYALANRMLLAPGALVGGAVSEAFRAELVQRLRRRERVEAFVLGLLARAAATAMVLIAGIALLGPLLFGTVFGERFVAAGSLLPGLAPLAMVGFLMMPVTHTLVATGRTRHDLMVQLVTNSLPVAALVAAWVLGRGFSDATWLVSGGSILGLCGALLVVRRVLQNVDAQLPTDAP